MPLSTHYYVLSLSETTNALFEAFRDALIAVESQGFPVVSPRRDVGPMGREHRLDLARRVDRCFGHHHAHDPLKLVVVGAPTMRSAFRSVTVHEAAVTGWIEGDHSGTRARDLGQIVWPVVREAISGVLDQTMRDLQAFAGRGDIASGLEAVARAAGRGAPSTLLVEDDYHVRGSIVDMLQPPVIAADVDVRNAIDDVVDAVIEKVLGAAGDVVFAPPGTLGDWKRIVLLLGGSRGQPRN